MEAISRGRAGEVGMVRKIPLGARVDAALKKALEKAAKEEMRSLSGLCEKILADWIKARKQEKPKK